MKAQTLAQSYKVPQTWPKSYKVPKFIQFKILNLIDSKKERFLHSVMLQMIDANISLPKFLLLVLSGDVETNPGPPRERKPDPKKVMEEKMNSHEEKISSLEKLVKDQKGLIDSMMEKQVDLEKELQETKNSMDDAVAEIRTDVVYLKERLAGVDKLGSQTSDASSKVKGMESALEELQDKLWELDKSWENNLVFYGIRHDSASEENMSTTKAKVREVLRTGLQIARDIPIVRVRRAYTGTSVRGTKPITVYFQKYEDKEEVLRKAKMLRGSNIYITEDFSKRVRDRRTELQKFMKELKKKQPQSKFSLRYDKLIVDKDVYSFNEQSGQVEYSHHKDHRDGDSPEPGKTPPTTPFRERNRSKSSGRRKKMQKSYSQESSLNHLVDPSSEDSRDPSPAKDELRSITPGLDSERSEILEVDSKSRLPSPVETNGIPPLAVGDEEDLDESEIAANFAALSTYNGPIRKMNPEIPETITEAD